MDLSVGVNKYVAALMPLHTRYPRNAKDFKKLFQEACAAEEPSTSKTLAKAGFIAAWAIYIQAQHKVSSYDFRGSKDLEDLLTQFENEPDHMQLKVADAIEARLGHSVKATWVTRVTGIAFQKHCARTKRRK